MRTALGRTKALSPAAEPLSQRLAGLNMGQCIARNGGNDDLTAVGDNHGIGLQVDDLVG